MNAQGGWVSIRNPHSALRNAEGGFLLVTLLAGTALVSALVLGMTAVTLQASQQAQRQVTELKAYYLAEGGIDHIVSSIRQSRCNEPLGGSNAGTSYRLEGDCRPELPDELGKLVDATWMRPVHNRTPTTMRVFTLTVETPLIPGKPQGTQTITAYVRDTLPDDFYDYVAYVAKKIDFQNRWDDFGSHSLVIGKMITAEPFDYDETMAGDMPTPLPPYANRNDPQPPSSTSAIPQELLEHGQAWGTYIVNRGEEAQDRAENPKQGTNTVVDYYPLLGSTPVIYNLLGEPITSVKYDPTIYPLPRFSLSALREISKAQGNYYGEGGKSFEPNDTSDDNDTPYRYVVPSDPPLQFYFEPPGAGTPTHTKHANQRLSGVPNVVYLAAPTEQEIKYVGLTASLNNPDPSRAEEWAGHVSDAGTEGAGVKDGADMMKEGAENQQLDKMQAGAGKVKDDPKDPEQGGKRVVSTALNEGPPMDGIGGFYVVDGLPFRIDGEGAHRSVFYTTSKGLENDAKGCGEGAAIKVCGGVSTSRLLYLDGAMWAGGDLKVEAARDGATTLIYNEHYMKAIKDMEIPADPQVVALHAGKTQGTDDNGE